MQIYYKAINIEWLKCAIKSGKKRAGISRYQHVYLMLYVNSDLFECQRLHDVAVNGALVQWRYAKICHLFVQALNFR